MHPPCHALSPPGPLGPQRHNNTQQHPFPHSNPVPDHPAKHTKSVKELYTNMPKTYPLALSFCLHIYICTYIVYISIFIYTALKINIKVGTCGVKGRPFQSVPNLGHSKYLLALFLLFRVFGCIIYSVLEGTVRLAIVPQ